MIILKMFAVEMLIVTGLTLGSSTTATAVNHNTDVVTAGNRSSHMAKRRNGSSGKMSAQQEQQLREMMKIKDEYNAAQNPIFREMHAIRVNWKTSNASKRVLLKQYRPRLDANIQIFEQKIQAYKNHPFYLLMQPDELRRDAYWYMDCPDDNATMCF
jgi:hypothetical protein